MKKIEEKIIVTDGQLKYAVSLKSEVQGERETYLRIRNGEIYFDSNYFSNIVAYDGSEETHEIAKQIFMTELQCAVKKRVSELKLLESVLMSIGIQEVLGSSLTESQKLLIAEQIKQEVGCAKEEIKEDVNNQIVKVVKPRAIKKKKSFKEEQK